jgi:hypothetical protein
LTIVDHGSIVVHDETALKGARPSTRSNEMIKHYYPGV